MNYFREATRQRLRIETSRGPLSVEQLWDLKLSDLASIIRNLKKKLKKENDDELSFLDDASTPVDKTLELSFNVVKEIYTILKSERDAIKNETERKANNAKIEALISQKEDEELSSLTVEQLREKLVD